MSDHFALNADGLTAMVEFKKLGFQTREEGQSSGNESDQDEWQKYKFSFSDYEDDDEMKECRICHEDDFVKNLEAPCACNGSLKMAHRACIQQWCNEKRSIICEICKQPYQDGYTISPPETILDINDRVDWDEETLIQSRMFTPAEVELLLGINPEDEYTIGDRVKAVIILAILMFKYFLLFLALVIMLISVFTWIRSLYGPRRRRRELSARLTAIPVAMLFDENLDYVNE